MHIRILGPSDEQRHRLERVTREVVAELQLRPQLEVADADGSAPAAGGSTPALLIDGSLKATGRVPTRNEIGSWLRPRLDIGR